MILLVIFALKDIHVLWRQAVFVWSACVHAEI